MIGLFTFASQPMSGELNINANRISYLKSINMYLIRNILVMVKTLRSLSPKPNKAVKCGMLKFNLALWVVLY